MCSDRRASSVNNFSKTVQKRFTHRRGKCDILNMSKGSFPPSSDRQTSLILFSFSFPLFFRTAKTLRRSGIPLPGVERFRLSGGAVFCRNKSFKLCSKTVHTLRRGVRYTNIVSKGSRNPDEADDLPIFLFLFFTPFFKSVYWMSRHRFRFPRRDGAFSLFSKNKRGGSACEKERNRVY